MVWREGQVKKLVTAAFEAGAAIDTRFAERHVPVADAVAWGQFLDEDHYSPDQWGIFGTSAAIRTLALRARPVEDNIYLRKALPLPRARDDYDRRLEAKVARVKAADGTVIRGDLQEIARLASIADALEYGRLEVPLAARPPLVQEIVDLADDGRHWCSTSAVNGAAPGQGDPPRKGDVFTTAYVLHALRRYEDPPGEFREHRLWLAQQLKERPAVRSQPHCVALIGLALNPIAPDPIAPGPIADGLKQCQAELIRWKGRSKIVLERPLFHGFNFGSWTDYVFLHPEIVTALFFLAMSNPKPARRYVLQVVEELTESIQPRGYFEGRPGMGVAMDQMWASRLLSEFHTIGTDKTRRKILRPTLIVGNIPVVVGVMALCATVGGLLIGLVGAGVGAGIGVFLSGLLGLLAPAAFDKE